MVSPGVRIELRIIDENLDPDFISRELDLEPTESWRRGDPSNIPYIKKEMGSWIYSLSEETYCDEELWKQFFEIFDKRRAKLKELVESTGANLYIDILVGMKRKESTPSVCLDPYIIELITDINGVVDIDLYVDGIEKRFSEKSRLFIDLSLVDDNLDPAFISKELNLEPSRSWRKGDPNRNPVFRPGTFYKFGRWLYEIKNEDSPNDDEALWEEFFSVFDKRREKIRKIVEEKDYWLCIDVAVYMDRNKGPAIHLDSKVLKLLRDMKATIGYDLYAY